MKKIVSLLLCIVLTMAALTALAVSVSAEEAGSTVETPGETPSATADIVMNGYQNEKDGFGVRIVGEIANAAEYREIGFRLSDGTTETKKAATYIFKRLSATNAAGEEYQALEAKEGAYLFALAIRGIEENDVLTLIVTPYAVNNDGAEILGAEKTLTKASGEQFKQKTDDPAHTHTPVHHAASAAGYATAGNTEYWSCEGCAELFSDETCGKGITLAEVTLAAQKDDETFENSETNPYLIANTADYEAFAAAVNAGDRMTDKYAKLTADIGTEEARLTTAIGTNTNSNYFAGNLDGDGHTVWVNIQVNHAAGVVAYLAGGSVANLTVRGSVTRAQAATAKALSYVGGVVGMITSAGGTVKNCKNYATVTGMDYCSVGGIVGHNTGVAEITECENYGEIVGTNLFSANIGVGGIVGRIAKTGTVLTDCHNFAPVSATNDTGSTTSNGVGGIVGFVGGAATMTNVTNEGEIKAPRAAGGIVGGTSATVIVTTATNKGAVVATDNYIGGIIGYVNGSGNVLTDCTNTGNIKGGKCVGGIVGLLNGSRTVTVDGADVHDCTIEGTQSVGGWIGRIVAKATAAYRKYAAPSNVIYKLDGVEQPATKGFETDGRTDGATAAPGEAFGTCPGTAVEETEN